MSYTQQLLAWALHLTQLWIPTSPASPPELREAIVHDTVEIVMDPAEAPIFSGPQGREKTVSLVLAIERFESDFNASVDEGVKRGKAGDACNMQIVIPRGKAMRLTADLYTWIWAKDAVETDLTVESLIPGSIPGRRQNCIRAGLHMVRESFRACRSLSLYTRGDCAPDPKAKHREQLARESFRRHPPPTATSEETL